jgi:outer membrane protein assembly factor BamB
MLGRDVTRNSASSEKNPPIDWNVGDFDRHGKWIDTQARNIKWVARLGSMTHGTPVVANGRIFIGTNNGAGYLNRYPANVDLGCLLCFRESDGEFLWQYSSEKLPNGRIHDWPMQGIGASPLVEGDRLWLVTNRWEIVCLDTRGFRDGENDGPVVDEPQQTPHEADVVWRFDMIKELDVFPHNQGMGPTRRSSPASSYKNLIYVVTGNGVDEGHLRIPKPEAPSLLCLDKNTGRVLWTDNSPGSNVLHGQFSSPLVAEIGGRAQVIIPQGDGWIRSFDALSGELIWKFDVNRKEAEWILGGRGERNHVLGTPVLYRSRVYAASGQEAEHGDGIGRLVCLDPTKVGDISAELAVDRDGQVIPHRRLRAVDPEKGERAIANANSGVIWEFTSEGDGFEDKMHRTISSVAIRNGLLIATDFSGLVHCFDADTGKRYWHYDCLAAVWSTTLIVDDRVYVADEDGDMAVFALSADPDVAMKGGPRLREPHAEMQLGNMVAGSPVFANGTLYVATRTHLFAIQGEQVARPDSANTGTAREPRAVAHSKPTQATAGPQTTRDPASDLPRVAKSVFSPTPHDVVAKMLELARVKEDDVVFDLGSGDGRIVVEAAKRFGCRAVGYELDPALVKVSRQTARQAGVTDRVTFHQADLFTADLSQADVLALYLLPVQTGRLIPRLKRMRPGVRIVSHQFPIPGVAPEKVIEFESKESGESHQLFLFITPITDLEPQDLIED